MKTNIETLFTGAVIGLLLGTGISLAILYETTSKQREPEAWELVGDDNIEPSTDPSPVIIWNDDTESIPQDGELVRLEMTQNDTIYIGPR
jgi:hypothetical protein